MTKGALETIELLKTLDGMPEPRIAKHLSFYELARKAPDKSVIVELGSWRGLGTIALAYGTLAGKCVRVLTYDSYSDRVGWVGEKYPKTDELDFWKNIKASGLAEKDITQMRVSFEYGARHFPYKNYISLLVWDGGCEDAMENVKPWLNLMIPGGIVAFHYLRDDTLGSISVGDELMKMGYTDKLEYPGCVYTLQAPKNGK